MVDNVKVDIVDLGLDLVVYSNAVMIWVDCKNATQFSTQSSATQLSGWFRHAAFLCELTLPWQWIAMIGTIFKLSVLKLAI